MSFQLADGLDRGFGLRAKDNGDIKVLMNFVGYFLVISLDASGVVLEVL